jgi:hypothetical protein
MEQQNGEDGADACREADGTAVDKRLDGAEDAVVGRHRANVTPRRANAKSMYLTPLSVI